MSDSDVYTNSFYADRDRLTRQSAEAVVAALEELVRPKSVIDLGCGVGTWLATFKRRGCSEILGLDGSYVNTKLLEIPIDCFLPFDLSTPVTVGRSFDLAMSLEVAEHIDARHAKDFVRSLTSLAPLVLFSAAIPQQGGTHHVNEQWPAYWNVFFEECGYVCIDALRSTLWDRDEILYWYRQNMLLFVRTSHLRDEPALERAYQVYGGAPRSLVHPETYLVKCNETSSFKISTANMFRAARKALVEKFAMANPKVG